MEDALMEWLNSPKGYTDVYVLLIAAMRYRADKPADYDEDVFAGAVCLVMDWARTKAKAS